jgi:hypothetical protein
VLAVRGEERVVSYQPAESQTDLFGGKLKLARTDLDADQLFAYRVACRNFIITIAMIFEWNVPPGRVSSPP